MRGPLKTFVVFLLCVCLCSGLCAFGSAPASAELEIGKVLATAVPTPVALMDVGNIPAATSTDGCYIAAYNWYDSSGNVLTGQFGTGSYQVAIQIGTYDGYYFSDTVQVFLNNSQAAYTLDPGKRLLTLYRDYTPDVWAPSVIKSPGGETVDEGGWASFVATATYVKSYSWTLTSPDGKTVYDCNDLPLKFPGLSVSDTNSEKVILHSIPAALDGWKIRCVFHGASEGADSYSNYAVINVNHTEPEPTPTPEPTATPGPTPSPSPSPEVSPSPSPGVSSGSEHVHTYSDTWRSDAVNHWKSCTCGARSEESAHDMRWTTVMKATRRTKGTERGVCAVCGYVMTRSVAYDAASDSEVNSLRVTLYILAVVLIVAVVVMLLSSIFSRRRGRRRRRRRR